MHGYPSGTPASAPGVASIEEVEAPAASSSISTRSRGNVVAAATVPFKAPADSEVSFSFLTLIFLLIFFFSRTTLLSKNRGRPNSHVPSPRRERPPLIRRI